MIMMMLLLVEELMCWVELIMRWMLGVTIHVPTIIDGAARRLTVSKSPLHLKFIDKAALVHSVFSEAFLVGVDTIVPTVIDLTALRWSLFEI